MPSNTDDILFEIPHFSQYKIVVAGDPLVGKTQLVSVFTKRDFEHKPTAGADISFIKLRSSGDSEALQLLYFGIFQDNKRLIKLDPYSMKVPMQ